MKTKKATLLLSVTTLLTLNVSVLFGQKTYKANVEKTKLEWLGEKVVGEHKGTIQLSSGEIEMDGNVITKGVFKINMKTIKDVDLTDDDSRNKLESHLRSEDFFNVNKYPVSTLTITNKPDFSNGSAMVKGNLTIKGTTHPIEFRATKKTISNGIKFYASIPVDRTKYDVRYGSGKFFDNLGDKTIYDEFQLKVNILMEEK
jgi:polyisoprenoid-binding protein YceI